MDRRTALKLFASLSSLSLAPNALAKSSKKRILVIGAGIIGASATYYLSKLGHKVTLIDQLAPASHATRGTFAWLNATWAKQPKHYHYLNQLGLNEWRKIAPELAIPVRWHGSIEWFDSEARTTTLAHQIEEQIKWGEPAKMIDASEIRRREPNIEVNDSVRAALSGNDGALDPIFATQQFIQAAKALGANILYPCEVLAPVFQSGQLAAVLTTTGTIQADEFVVATGANPILPESLSKIALPQRTTPGVIAITEPLPPLVHSIVAAPGVHLHQRHDGKIVLGEQAGAPVGQAHELRLKGRPNDFPHQSIARAHGERILNVAASYFPALKNAQIENCYIGWRPLPIDGHPVLGHSIDQPNVYLAVMHSGISLGPLAGKIIAQEVGLNTISGELAAYRPTRNFIKQVRY